MMNYVQDEKLQMDYGKGTIEQRRIEMQKENSVREVRVLQVGFSKKDT